jgi:hypothetical protein
MANPLLEAFRALFNLEYGEETELLLSSGESIPSRRGTRQGSVGGGLFFCVCLQPVLEKMRLEHPSCVFLAYMDDITIIGHVHEAKLAFERLRVLLTEIGIEVNRSKCEMLTRDRLDTAPDGVAIADGSIKLLGAFIGDDECCSARIVEHMKKRTSLFARLEHMPPHEALNILSKCGVPRMNYVIRTHDPDVTEAACDEFDRAITTCANAILVTDMDDLSRKLAKLPKRNGGLNIWLYDEMRVDAYQASMQTSQFVCGLQSAAPPLQKDLAELRNKATIASLREDPATARLLCLTSNTRRHAHG